MYEKGTFPMHLYKQLSINKVLNWSSCLNVRLISSHTLDMFFKTNFVCKFLGCKRFVSKHFSAPHTKTRWTPLFSLNRHYTMAGCNFFWTRWQYQTLSYIIPITYDNWVQDSQICFHVSLQGLSVSICFDVISNVMFHIVSHSHLKPTNGKHCYQATCLEKKQNKHPQVN